MQSTLNYNHSQLDLLQWGLSTFLGMRKQPAETASRAAARRPLSASNCRDSDCGSLTPWTTLLTRSTVQV
ncbi:hypothetical protein LshimejAT787_1101160 [Lyophyllum shimeji]|uniref:Uncharacterized protein n=1 Tax=Lyophyllum shimeji TaxID=47721 RepID=A0A9P3UTF4_LYOSH|nr:hypothetical protein LshimejAT787_1101160 [Lyophyllum shimeji]